MTHREKVQVLKNCLSQYKKAEKLSNDFAEVAMEKTDAVLASIPREGIFEALDEALAATRIAKPRPYYVQVLAQLSDLPEAAQRIAAELGKCEEKELEYLIQSIGHSQIRALAPQLNPFILGERINLREHAISAARKLKMEVNLPALLALADDPEKGNPYYVLPALAVYRHESCRTVFEKAFAQYAPRPKDAEDPYMANSRQEYRVFAAWGLAGLGDEAAFDYLVSILDAAAEAITQGRGPGNGGRAARAIHDVKGWKYEFSDNRIAVQDTKIRLGLSPAGGTGQV